MSTSHSHEAGWGSGIRTCRFGPRISDALARGFVLLLGTLAAVAAFGRLAGSAPDADLVWIDLRWMPGGLRTALLALAAVAWLGWSIRPAMGRMRRRFTLGVTGIVGALMLANAAVVMWLWISGQIVMRVPVPLSAVLAGATAWAGLRMVRTPSTDSRLSEAPLFGVGLGFAAWAMLFPILQIFTLGHTDYRRLADIAVVPGARVHADGRLSDAVADRVRMAVELYRQGWVRQLHMSGGPGDGAVHEVEAMRDAAVLAGVPAEVIGLDFNGLNTRATARNTPPEAGRVIVVSEFYHLPRIRLAYAEQGRDVVTVPAVPRFAARWMPVRSVVREIPAWWLYYLRSLPA